MKIVLGSTGSGASLDVIAVMVAEDEIERDAAVGEIDEAMGGALRAAIKDEEFTAKRDTSLVVSTQGRIAPRRVVLLGLGQSAKVTVADVRVAAAKAGRTANSEKATSLGLTLRASGGLRELRAAAEGVALGAYRFTRYLTGDRRPKKEIARVVLGRSGANTRDSKATPEEKRALAEAQGVARGVCLARDMVNEPPNEMTPARMAEAAIRVAADNPGMSIKVLDRAGIRKAGMKLLDAVGRGSRNEPRFIHITYKPQKQRKGRKRVVIVGKGLTFDSGGLCIKPAAGMGDMKSDMGGAALAIGAMAAIGAIGSDAEVHALIAAAENMPDGDAYRPGDVFGSLDGKTVEIINTDAEGRLVLADALAYGRKLEPDMMIDHATLTGACIVALGTFTSGFYCNDEALSTAYLEAARDAGESMWRMPLLEELREGLKSDVADIKHTADRYGGSITAALFLKEFIGDTKWIHVDIAGPAFLERQSNLGPKGATGYGVLSFVNYIERLNG